MHASLYFIHCISPLHIGCGDETTVIEAPIARVQSSNLPYIPDSAIKGSWRGHTRDDNSFKHKTTYFGPDHTNASMHAGALKFTSASLLCMPVRSVSGTFAWVTSTLQLRLFLRDMRTFQKDSETNYPLLKAIENVDSNSILLSIDTKDSEVNKTEHQSPLLVDDGTVILEDIELNVQKSEYVNSWSDFFTEQLFASQKDWQLFFRERFCVVSDDTFQYFTETCSEIRTRNSIDELTGAAKDTGLWTEELMPTESIFWGGIASELKSFNKAIDLDLDMFKSQRLMQIGGNATLGQGLIRWSTCH